MPEEANSKSDNWMERLARVKAARARLENYYGDSDALAVLEKHIADEKWEIRQCVADAIPLLPESRLTPFIPLCKDCNHYVSNSAQSGSVPEFRKTPEKVRSGSRGTGSERC